MKTIEELKALREEWEVNSLTRGSNNQERREVLAIIDTALAVIAERDAARAVTAEVQGAFGLTRAAARSLAMADAVARLRAWVADYEAIHDDRGVSVMEAAIAAIRALAPLPLGLVAVRKEAIDAVRVEAESLQRVANALVTIAERARDDLLHCRDGGSSAFAHRAIERMDAAASALPDQNLAEALALLKEGA